MGINLSYSTIVKTSLLWLPLLLWYLLGFIFTHNHHFFSQVDSIYYAAAQAWLHQQPLYHCHGNGCFVYLPTSAVLFIPFGLLPLKTAELIYRFISIIIFTQGIYYFCRDITSYDLKRTFFIVLLTTVLLSQPTLFVGQVHMMMAGLILLAVSAITREKWWRAAIALSFCFALKPTAIVFCLLSGALYPQTALKQILIIALLLSAVFLTQSSHYVLTQYHGFIQEFLHKMEYDTANIPHWATLFGAIAFYTGHVVDGHMAFVIRMLAALGVVYLGICTQKTQNKNNAVYFIFTLGMCYLMLFNSRTENNDYVMMMPFMGYSLMILMEEKRWLLGVSFMVGLVLMMANWNLSKMISPGNNLWLNPTLIMLYTLYIISDRKNNAHSRR